jgi:prevent-host-death family protein
MTVPKLRRKLGEAQRKARQEPVQITQHGRREFVLISAEYYDWLTAAAKRKRRTTDSAFALIDVVKRAEMDAVRP